MSRLIGYACPPGSPTHGERHRVEYCLGQCPHPCVSPPLLAAIHKAETANHHTGSYISASMLSMSGCPRQTVFERLHDFYEQPIKRWWPFRGTIAHAIVEDAGEAVAPYGWMQELRMRVPLHYPELQQPEFDDNGVWTGRFLDEELVILLGGTTDAYNPLIPAIHDYKSMADVKVNMFAERGEADPKHAEQLNVYRWLVAHTRIDADMAAKCRFVGFDPEGHEFLPSPTELVIQGFSMMALARTGSTVELKVKKDTSKYAGKATFEIQPIEARPLDEIEAWIRPRALDWYRWLVMGEPTPVTSEADKWLCRLCPFNGELVPGGRCFPTAERNAQ